MTLIVDAAMFRGMSAEDIIADLTDKLATVNELVAGFEKRLGALERERAARAKRAAAKQGKPKPPPVDDSSVGFFVRTCRPVDAKERDSWTKISMLYAIYAWRTAKDGVMPVDAWQFGAALKKVEGVVIACFSIREAAVEGKMKTTNCYFVNLEPDEADKVGAAQLMIDAGLFDEKVHIQERRRKIHSIASGMVRPQ